MQAYTRTHHFEIKNAKNFLRRGTPPPQNQSPRRLRCLDIQAYGVQAQRDTPQKSIVTALGAENHWFVLTKPMAVNTVLPINVQQVIIASLF